MTTAAQKSAAIEALKWRPITPAFPAMSPLPFVDISPFTAGGGAAARAMAAAQWDAAMREWGVALITGHGLPDAAA